MERKRRVWVEWRGRELRSRWRGACRIIVKTVEEEREKLKHVEAMKGGGSEY